MPELKAQEGCCEEASSMSRDFYIPCNAPASKVLSCDRDGRDYRMCEPCAWHNLRRGMVDVTNETKLARLIRHARRRTRAWWNRSWFVQWQRQRKHDKFMREIDRGNAGRNWK